jgi:hypothetical protein
MATLLATLAEVKREFYHLLNTSANDAALTEHDAVSGDHLLFLANKALWNAQMWLADEGLADRWRKTGAALSVSGTDAADGGRYATLPTDFLRLLGDRAMSGLRDTATWHPWGTEVSERDLDDAYGDFFAVRDGVGSAGAHDHHVLWLARGAAPPSSLKPVYIAKHATLTSNTSEIDFSDETAELVPAFMADLAKWESWVPGGDEMVAKVEANLREAKARMKAFTRRTSTPEYVAGPRARYGGKY